MNHYIGRYRQEQEALKRQKIKEFRKSFYYFIGGLIFLVYLLLTK